MSVFRVEKTKDYTVMSNYHLRDKTISLKAKGLLSQMLSLPKDWDYTLKGLALINKEKVDSIRQSVLELERAGYIIRTRERNKDGTLGGMEYIIYEHPQSVPSEDTPKPESPKLGKPMLGNPVLEKPTLENPTLEKPTLENPTQLNIDIQSKEKQNTDLSITQSYPIQSHRHTGESIMEQSSHTDKIGLDRDKNKTAINYRKVIIENIEYDHLMRYTELDQDILDGILEILTETVCTSRRTIRIAGDDYPSDMVRERLLSLNSEHIKYVMDCMQQNTTRVRNIKKYLLAALFNAPTTMSSYYAALISHDMAQ